LILTTDSEFPVNSPYSVLPDVVVIQGRDGTIGSMSSSTVTDLPRSYSLVVEDKSKASIEGIYPEVITAETFHLTPLNTTATISFGDSSILEASQNDKSLYFDENGLLSLTLTSSDSNISEPLFTATTETFLYSIINESGEDFMSKSTSSVSSFIDSIISNTSQPLGETLDLKSTVMDSFYSSLSMGPSRNSQLFVSTSQENDSGVGYESLTIDTRILDADPIASSSHYNNPISGDLHIAFTLGVDTNASSSIFSVKVPDTYVLTAKPPLNETSDEISVVDSDIGSVLTANTHILGHLNVSSSLFNISSTTFADTAQNLSDDGTEVSSTLTSSLSLEEAAAGFSSLAPDNSLVSFPILVNDSHSLSSHGTSISPGNNRTVALTVETDIPRPATAFPAFLWFLVNKTKIEFNDNFIGSDTDFMNRKTTSSTSSSPSLSATDMIIGLMHPFEAGIASATHASDSFKSIPNGPTSHVDAGNPQNVVGAIKNMTSKGSPVQNQLSLSENTPPHHQDDEDFLTARPNWLENYELMRS
ncbi:hypothetical protein SK128_014956, partial [Halocaridina rubra]